MSRKSTSDACKHELLLFTPSSYAAQAGYCTPTAHQRSMAASVPTPASSNPKNKAKKASVPQDRSAAAFPAPIVLPGDDLAEESEDSQQGVSEWLKMKERNSVTPRKKVVYVVAPPAIEDDVDFISTWSHPELPNELVDSIAAPRFEDLMKYLEAFYHGLTVKQLPPANLSFTGWEESSSIVGKRKAKFATPQYIGVNTSKECIRIRTRGRAGSVYTRQLNLDDLLDVAISILPADAYALLLLIEHDLFEDDDDEFVCGRAYGGSRVAVISTARYHPVLDAAQNVERNHAWPASHCAAYTRACCSEAVHSRPPVKKRSKIHLGGQQKSDPIILSSFASSSVRELGIRPLEAAVSAHAALPSLNSKNLPVEVLSGLWLGRVCRTASHELGHCFGIAHCVYYACVMQGSASLTEDARQPPYLCPVDLAKLLRATGADAIERYRALLAFCNEHTETHLFVAFAAWLNGQLGKTDS
ncbi:MAG: hypothetical protein M1835_001210 [Candelina submexicana]|nr:MAG: hypothetical protein M1835_001210 [Candelina submexicana]